MVQLAGRMVHLDGVTGSSLIKVLERLWGMGMIVKRYPQEAFCADFFRVVDFLKQHGARGLNENWHWARWEWLLGHSNLDMTTLPQIGIFEQDGVIVGIATHDMRSGEAYIICNPDFQHIKTNMVQYVEENLSYNGESGIYINDEDESLIGCVKASGYRVCDKKEYVLALDCKKSELHYELDGSFSIVDDSNSKDLNKYYRVMWKGFDHEGLPPFITDADVVDRPHENPELAVFVVASDGEYAAHCGTWYLPGTKEAYIEPVVTVPEYRKRGLGKVAVYESITRCIEMGAETALVISNQQFYHKIGFRESSVYSLWKKNVNPVA
jgi:GNAT superfamily N-acetyltransferase